MAWLKCRCGNESEHESETLVWIMHQEHAAEMIAADDGAVHDVVEFGKPFTRHEVPTEMSETLHWVADSVHKMYHGRPGPIERCDYSTCVAAVFALRKAGYEVSVPSVLPAVFAPRDIGADDHGAHAQPAQAEGDH